MTPHGSIQGYNGQALVNAKHQVIVEGEVFGWGQDHHHMEPVVSGAQENMKAVGKGDDYFNPDFAVGVVARRLKPKRNA